MGTPGTCHVSLSVQSFAAATAIMRARMSLAMMSDSTCTGAPSEGVRESPAIEPAIEPAPRGAARTLIQLMMIDSDT